MKLAGGYLNSGRNEMRAFFKTVERWTQRPLPTEEIIREEEGEILVHGEPKKGYGVTWSKRLLLTWTL